MTDLSGKVALITGAGQGVGQGIALALAAAGAKVAVTGRTLAKLEATSALVAERGGEALAIAGNVKDAASLADMVAQTVERFGGLDILVNNAQEVPNGKLLDVTDEAFLAGFESGPLASFRLMKLAHPHMVARGGGVIVNLASSAGIRWDMTGYGAYGAVKQATRVLTRAAAVSAIPTSTGAAKAVGLVMPELKGKLDGTAIRIPTPNVSLVSLDFVPRAEGVTKEAVNAAMKKAAEGELKGILGYCTAPLVSIDFNHDPHSSTFDATQTQVVDGGLVRVLSWYDNEWGFSNRMSDTAALFGRL